MKVALVCPYSLTLPGGVQGQVLGLARELRSLGIDARVVGPCDGPPPETGVTSVGRSIRLPANGSVAPIAPDPAAAARTLAALRAEGPDIVHLHEPFVPGPCLTAVLAAKGPFVGTFHASGSAPGYTFFMPVVRFGSRRLSARVAVSERARALAQRSCGGEWRVIGNALDFARISSAEPWPLAPGEGRPILFVGRHEPRKGLGVLLDAFEGLGGGATLWVVGEGPQTAALRARGVEGVQWLGRVGDAELRSRLRAAAVVCVPSLEGESFGVVLLEGMAAGAVVVASEIDGYREVARADVEALLVAPGDPTALRAALERGLTDEVLGRRLREAGADRAASFSMRGQAEAYVELYESVLAGRGRSTRMMTGEGRP